jgi:predicted NAD-dependent protein-ADP-ribosyltransferase YbiA (DUF1768 family)
MLNLSKAQRKTVIVSAEGALSALHADSKYGFVLDSKDFKTFMHYYYYCISTGDKTLQNNIIKNSSINNARLSLGSITCNRLLDYQIVIRQYNSHKLCTLLIRGIIEKCQQNPIVKMVLNLSGDSQINFDCGNDTYLGVGPDGLGLNVMGVLTMIVRSKFNFKGKNGKVYAEDKFTELNSRIRAVELSKPGLSLTTIEEDEKESVEDD